MKRANGIGPLAAISARIASISAGLPASSSGGSGGVAALTCDFLCTDLA